MWNNPQGVWYSVRGDAGSHTVCIEPWDRLMLQIQICNLLWRVPRCIFLLQHLSYSGCPTWVRRQQLFLLGYQGASLGGAINSCRRHSLIFGAEFLHRLVSHYSSDYLHLFISHVVSHGTFWCLEAFIFNEGNPPVRLEKPSSLAGVSLWIIFLPQNLQPSLKLAQSNVQEHSPFLQLNPSSSAWHCWTTHNRDEIKLSNSGIQLPTHTTSWSWSEQACGLV